MDTEMNSPATLSSDASPAPQFNGTGVGVGAVSQQQQQQQQQQPGAAPIKRRAPIACRRCRRMRSKCLHEKGKTPCQACFDAGIDAEGCGEEDDGGDYGENADLERVVSIFPVRGQPDQDRDYRHPRIRAEKTSKRDQAKVRREILDAPIVRSPTAPSVVGIMPRLSVPKAADDWDLLPPLPEIIDAVNKFTRHYFQLGFIHRQSFPETLRTNHRSVSVFFLLSLLSISARLTPALVERYGSAVKAAETFMERASHVALSEVYKEPSVERCQAFYLLSIAQQGSGIKYHSSINMGISLRIATFLQLHREETYDLVNPTKESIIEAESARRTLWMLHSQDNLHSGVKSPISLSASDITTRLPCNEQDYADAVIPKSRAALEDTPPAIENPQLTSLRDKSLFATLIQAHYYWGAISRRAIAQDKSPRPWEPQSDYSKMARRLADWESHLPGDHRWSNVLLKGHKQEGQDLAYLGVTMITRLCNMVIRKAYLNEMINDDRSDPNLTKFWNQMSTDLFNNVHELFDQINTQWNERSGEEGMGGQMAAFIIFSCGFMAVYLTKHRLAVERSVQRNAKNIVHRILQILSESKDIWPLAGRWHTVLENFYRSRPGTVPEAEGSMADSREPIPHALHHSPVSQTTPQLTIKPRSPGAKSNGATCQSPNTPMAPVSRPPRPPQPKLQPQPSPSPANYIEPSLRGALPGNLPATQPPTPGHQPVSTHVHGQAQAQAQPQPQPQTQPHVQIQVMDTRQAADGLNLLISAFDEQQVGSIPQVPPQQYDPNVSPQGYYPQPGLAGDDGYEAQMEYYMTESGPAVNWMAPGMGTNIPQAMGGMPLYGYAAFGGDNQQ